MLSSCRGKRTGCSPRPLQPEIKLLLGYVSILPSTAPFLISLIISHLLARNNLEGMREEREGMKGAFGKFGSTVGTSASQLKHWDLTSKNAPKGAHYPVWRCNIINVRREISKGYIFTQTILKIISFLAIKCLSSSHQRSMAFNRAIPHTLFWKVYTWASSAEGDFSHLFCITKTGNKAALRPVSGPQRKREEVIFELWDMFCCHTLPDYFSPACCWRERNKRICAVTQVYVSALLSFCTFCCAANSMRFHA